MWCLQNAKALLPSTTKVVVADIAVRIVSKSALLIAKFVQFNLHALYFLWNITSILWRPFPLILRDAATFVVVASQCYPR